MPIDKDPHKGGTLRDGTRTRKYCSLCYENGSFRDNFNTADEMISFVKGKLKEMGYSSMKRWFFTSHIPNLERWQA